MILQHYRRELGLKNYRKEKNIVEGEINNLNKKRKIISRIFFGGGGGKKKLNTERLKIKMTFLNNVFVWKNIYSILI